MILSWPHGLGGGDRAVLAVRYRRGEQTFGETHRATWDGQSHLIGGACRCGAEPTEIEPSDVPDLEPGPEPPEILLA